MQARQHWYRDPKLQTRMFVVMALIMVRTGVVCRSLSAAPIARQPKPLMRWPTRSRQA